MKIAKVTSSQCSVCYLVIHLDINKCAFVFNGQLVCKKCLKDETRPTSIRSTYGLLSESGRIGEVPLSMNYPDDYQTENILEGIASTESVATEIISRHSFPTATTINSQLRNPACPDCLEYKTRLENALSENVRLSKMCEELSAYPNNWNVIINTVNSLVDGKTSDNLSVYGLSNLKVAPMQKYPELKVEKSKYIAASNAKQPGTAAKILLLEYFDELDLSKTNMDGLKRPHPEHFKMISGYFDF